MLCRDIAESTTPTFTSVSEYVHFDLSSYNFYTNFDFMKAAIDSWLVFIGLLLVGASPAELAACNEVAFFVGTAGELVKSIKVLAAVRELSGAVREGLRAVAAAGKNSRFSLSATGKACRITLNCVNLWS